MAGQYEADLCRVILEERFGVSVGLVMGTLLREPSNLSGLFHTLRGKISPTMIKKAMAVLEQFSILKFKVDGNNRIGYSVDHEAVTALLKAPRCGMLLQKLHGKGLEIFLCLLYNGRLSCSEVIRKMARNSDSADEPIKSKELFDRLVEAQFLIRCPTVDHTHHGCPQFQTSSDLYVLPEKIAPNFSSSEEDVNSRKRKHGDNDPDSDILWRVNFQRFDRYFRDEIIQEMVVPQNWTGDEKTSKICKQTLLALFKANEMKFGNLVATSSNPISVYDIAKCSKDNNLGVEKADIDWALRVLVEDARGVIRKAGDSGGGLFVIDFDRAIRLSCQHHVECLIREQLDTKAVRVFRLLQSKGYLEEEQVEKMTMMSPKETRELLFAMQEEGYVFTKPIGKTQDFAPARTFYLYYVDLTKIVRGVMEYTCKSLRNLILRRKQEFLENRWLIEKRSTMQNIIDETEADPNKDDATKQEEIADVRETYMPAANMAKYKKFEDARDLLDKAEAETERVLLTFRLHLLLSKQPSPL